MAYNYRCNKADCRKRVTLAHEIEWYIRVPKCQQCKRPDTLRFDPWVRDQTLRRTCKCIGVHFPHRKGTVISENEFCYTLSLDQVEVHLIERDILSPEEVSAL
ncbi:MAG: hypothetical protein E4H01_07490 [Lysobacterales bacterium]|nr:MAG: hypothetical protein E4H01_07490 [Xanthomonadales bacterium]